MCVCVCACVRACVPACVCVCVCECVCVAKMPMSTQEGNVGAVKISKTIKAQHAHIACTHSMHAQHARTACTHSMHTQHARTACTQSMHTQHAHTACTHSMHAQHVHTPLLVLLSLGSAKSVCTLTVAGDVQNVPSFIFSTATFFTTVQRKA